MRAISRSGFAKVGALIGGLCLAIALSPAAGAATSPGFDDEASQFSIFYDCHPAPCTGHGGVSNVPSPSEDGQSLKFDYAAGNAPYMGIYAYHKFPADHAATRFQINYDFMFPNRAPIQALEFPMNDYVSNTRYQWALQWENKGTGGTWRLWNGSSWQATGVSDTGLAANTWYTLTLDGNIVGGQVHYLDFVMHGVNHSLTQFSFAPTAGTGDFLAAAMQLDGDTVADPYDVYYDNSHFYWS